MHPHCRISRVRLKASPHLSVIVPDISPLGSVPDMMERVAADIRRGLYGRPRSAAMVLETDDPPVAVFGWGETNVYHSNGLLAAGQHELGRVASD